MKTNPLMAKMGFADTDRVAIIHVDDVGMCQASVEAFDELWIFGLITSGAVMVPCAWFPAAAAYARQTPGVDLGVHLTLTSEWDTYRWGPLSTIDPASGLIDEEGYFPRATGPVQDKASVDVVVTEVKAQIERALAAGMQPTHADTHMGTLAHTKFLPQYIQSAIEYGLPPMMVRLDEEGLRKVNEAHGSMNLDEEMIQTAIEQIAMLEQMGVPLLDAIVGMPLDTDPLSRMVDVKAAFDALKPGITHFIIHAAKDTPELRAIAPDWACRVADYETFMQGELREYLDEIGIKRIGYRDVQMAMRST